MMGGDITLDSVPGQGSPSPSHPATVEARPSAAASQAEGEDAAVQRASHGANSVLVIDDEPEPRDLISRHLQKHGIRVVTAAGGEEGLKLARQLHPAAITLDIVMPRLDGWAVLEALKADPATADIPVIIVSLLDKEDMGFAVGAMGYMTKPIDWERLMGMLTRYTNGTATLTSSEVEDEEPTRDIRRTLQKQGWALSEAGRRPRGH
jgi:CheY-like chemotaxis protein